MKKKYAHVFVLAALMLFTTQPVFADTLTFSGEEDRPVEAADSSGATVAFDVMAQDASSTPFAVTCDPASDSLFPIGTTTVSCEAVDDTSATSSTSFDVGVFEMASSTLPIATSTSIVIEGHIDVPAACTVVDTDGASHDYLAASSTAYIGICALAAAKDDALISDFQATNFSFGLFITSVGGIDADPSSQYWALFLNSDFPSVGLTDLPIAAGDTIELQLHDFSDTDLGDRLTLHIDSLIATSSATTSPPAITLPPPSDGGGGHGGSDNDMFNLSDALAYLSSHQNANGSFDSDMITDWVAIGLASVKSSTALSKIKAYMQTASPKISSVTDAERHAMALQALGINPYTGTSVDYIAPIVAAFDGTQIGAASLVNDDIFAVLPLMHAGYSTSDSIIQKTTAFIIAQQKTNGSWGDADMTAAAIQALQKVTSLPNVDTALAKAADYLHTQQQSNGGFIGASGVNSFSTSWALQAIAALGQSPSSWTPASKTPEDYLAGLQESDGGIDTVSTPEAMRIWATAYAIPAAQNKTWDSLLSSFSKPSGSNIVAKTSAATSTNVASNATTSTPTAASDADAATSTPLVLGAATSTPTIVPAVTPKPAPKKVVTTTRKDPASTAGATSTPETNPQSQTAAVESSQDRPNVFVRIWNFFKKLFGL
ncbi:MAG TPA: DUF4430 domain-containing protein [Candidatus Paceibacterota bacterium]